MFRFNKITLQAATLLLTTSAGLKAQEPEDANLNREVVNDAINLLLDAQQSRLSA